MSITLPDSVMASPLEATDEFPTRTPAGDPDTTISTTDTPYGVVDTENEDRIGSSDMMTSASITTGTTTAAAAGLPPKAPSRPSLRCFNMYSF